MAFTEVPQGDYVLVLPNLEGPLSDLMPSFAIVAADSEEFT